MSTKRDTIRGPLAPPPPPTLSGSPEPRPKIGAPFEVPALIIKNDDQPEVEDAAEDVLEEIEEVEEAEAEAHAASLPRPAALPVPGARRPPVDPGLASRFPDVEALPASSSASVPGGEIATRNASSLVEELASEIVDSASASASAPASPEPAAPVTRPASDKRRKLALYFVGGAVLLSLIVAVLPSGGSEDEDDDDATEAPATVDEPDEAAAPTKPPSSAAEAGAERDEVEPADPSEPAPDPTPEHDSESDDLSGGPLDKRSVDELYAAANEAYHEGDAAEAYRLAVTCWHRKNSPQTAELLTRAACKMKDEAKATLSLAKVPAAQRSVVKEDCLAMGMELE